MSIMNMLQMGALSLLFLIAVLIGLTYLSPYRIHAFSVRIDPWEASGNGETYLTHALMNVPYHHGQKDLK